MLQGRDGMESLTLPRNPLADEEPEEGPGWLSPPTTRREERGLGRSLRAHAALQAGRCRLALFHCRRAGRLFPGSLDVQVLKAVALHRLGRHRDALEVHRQLQERVPRGPATAALACHSARLCVRVGDHRQAVEWLRRAEAQDPGRTRLEAADPLFDALRDSAWLQSLRQAPSEWDPSVA